MAATNNDYTVVRAILERPLKWTDSNKKEAASQPPSLSPQQTPSTEAPTASSSSSSSSEEASPSLSPDTSEPQFDPALSQVITNGLETATIHRLSSDWEMAESTAYNPGYFSGKDGEDPELFLDNLTAYSALRNSVDPLKIVPLALKDGARVWFLNLADESKADWAAFKAAFLGRYGPAEVVNFSKVGEIFEAKQGPLEKSRDFVSRITHKCNVAKLDEAMTVKALLNGLLPHLRTYVLTKDAKTIADVEKHAITAELVQPRQEDQSIVAAMDALREEVSKLQRSSSPSRPRRSITPQRYSARSPTPRRQVKFEERQRSHRSFQQSKDTCFRCGGRYDNNHNCRAKEATCYNCGKTGHYRRKCKSGRPARNFH